MRRWALFTLLLSFGACSGCKNEAGRNAPKAGDEPADNEADQGPYQITADKLDRYIKYEAKMNTVLAELARAVEGLPAPVQSDGGTVIAARPKPATPAEMVALTKKRADAEEAARKELGLSERDVEQMGLIVDDIVSKRVVAKGVVDDTMIAQMEQMKQQLAKDPNASAQIDKSVADAKKLRDEVQNLKEEREKYGDKNVDLVLTREADLVRNWDARASAYGGRAP